MIGYFPTPHPDELFHSVCARYSDRVMYSSKKAISHVLFGNTNATAVTDFPSHLGSLIDGFPPNSHYTVERIIDEQTLLPFFAAFLPYERVRQIKEDMKGSNGHAIYMRSGVMAGRIPQPEWLRFCPLCVIDDRKGVKEAYWHRLHQLPGVEVCPAHSVFLEKSNARARHSQNSFQLLLAEDYIPLTIARPLDLSDLSHKALLEIAVDASWLLKQRNPANRLEALRNRYLILLIERGLASYSGCIRAGKLLSRFKEHYPISLLKLLNCQLVGKNQVKDNWLLHLVRKATHAHHPLRHLLLIRFFGISAEDFFALPEEINYFGDSPWPCLNPAVDHYREARITDYHISFRGPKHRPVATFQCDCGFSYARTGPDLSHEDRFRISKMKSFGPVWEKELIKLWSDSTISVSEIARQLGVDPLTVRRYATQLGLSFVRANRKGINPISFNQRLKAEDIQKETNIKRRNNRRKWLTTMKGSQKITLKALRQKLPRIYAWLVKNDKAWLKIHKPHKPKSALNNSSVDWKQRDTKLAFVIRSTALDLFNAPGKPVFVSASAISKCLGITSMLRQKSHKLPLSVGALANMVETRETFAARRVWWAAHCYQQEGVIVRRWQLILRANVYRWRKAPQVESALDAAMEILEQSNAPLIKLSLG